MRRLLSPSVAALLAALLRGPALADAADSVAVSPDSTGASASHRHFTLGAGHTGLSFGNARRVTGIRLNLRDTQVEAVNGINVTFWKAGRNPRLVINGVAAGLVGPEASLIRGVAVGPAVGLGDGGSRGIAAGMFAVGSGNGDLRGVTLGGLAVGTGDGDVTGIALGGLAVGSGDGPVDGITLAGLAVGTGDGRIRGVTLAGLAVGSGEGRVTGITAAGLAVGAGDGRIRGLTVAGLAVGTGDGGIDGISAAGLAVGSGRKITGAAVSGGVVGAPRLSGLALAALKVHCGETIRGVAVGGVLVPMAVADWRMGSGWKGWLSRSWVGLGTMGLGAGVYAREVRGVTLGVVNGLDWSGFRALRRTESFTGLSVGLVNWTRRLRGVQIGLLNYVAENPAGLRLLPFLNLRLRGRQPAR